MSKKVCAGTGKSRTIMQSEKGYVGRNYVSAAEAVKILKVKPQTLYAYVSRGLVRRIHVAGKKENLYSLEDVEKVKSRKAARLGRGAIAADAMFAGAPIVTSNISELAETGPRYRGHDATNLLQHPGQFECVAELLWTGILHDDPVSWEIGPFPTELAQVISAMSRSQHQFSALQYMEAATVATRQSLPRELQLGNTASLARQLIAIYAACLGVRAGRQRLVEPKKGATIADQVVASAIDKTDELHASAVNAALILCADHELSAATFAARVCASTQASLHDCLLTALATHSGDQLGGGCVRVEEMLRKCTSKRSLSRNVKKKLQSGLQLPGFTHPVYTSGDPRTKILLDLATEVDSHSQKKENLATFLTRIVSEETGQAPNIEVGLVALSMSLNLPAFSASPLWAISRSAGWIAHVIEQRLSGVMLRPRARYRGTSISVEQSIFGDDA